MAATTARTLALVSFIAGVAANLVQILVQIVIVALVTSAGYLALEALQSVTAVISLGLGLAAVVTGVIVLVQRGAPKALAAAGTALGAVVVIGTAVSLVQSALLTVF